MKKIEEKMLKAIRERKNMKLANTQVIVTDNGIFVKLYNTLIYAYVGGSTYYSDGGWCTVTTSSRLRALGADYSINPKLCKDELVTQQRMRELYQGL